MAAERNHPPNGTFGIVFTGRTSVEDYMRYEGVDAAGKGYELALREREVAQTSGAVTEVGVGFTQQYASYAMHHSVDCTVATH